VAVLQVIEDDPGRRPSREVEPDLHHRVDDRFVDRLGGVGPPGVDLDDVFEAAFVPFALGEGRSHLTAPRVVDTDEIQPYRVGRCHMQTPLRTLKTVYMSGRDHYRGDSSEQ